MDSPFDTRAHLKDFCGVAPLFPLPGTVFFPHILLPLHIFEPRYRRMTADLLAGDRLLAMALLRPGPLDAAPGALWTPAQFASDSAASGSAMGEVGHEDGDAGCGASPRPPIHRTVCLGRVAAEERLPDGRYYLVLQGLSRARVVSEVEDVGLPYRLGRLELLDDRYPAAPTIDREHHWRQILSGFRTLFPDVHLDRMFQQARSREVPLGVLADVLAYAMKLGPFELQRLLNELDVDRRAARVVRLMQGRMQRQDRSGAKATKLVAKSPAVEFPPQFSVN